MNQPNHPPFRNTSLPLIVLTLLAGVALGWLLRDRFVAPAAQAPTPAPTLATLPTIAPATPPPATLAPTEPSPTVAPPTTTALPAPIPSQTPAPEPTHAPEPSPAQAAPAGYIGHIVEEGETLATIAARGGSTPELIAQYNRLTGEPQPGRMLIVPRAEGAQSSLESAPLLVQRGRSGKPWVALTLDAGADSAPVPAMLKTLREHNIKLTFFLTGQWIKDNPGLAR